MTLFKSNAMKRMQCKDIPDKPILEFLRSLDGKWGCIFQGFENSVCNAMPLEAPRNLVAAKMDSLIRRGLVTGCTCGCRGDFELTEKGRKIIEEAK